MGSKSTYRDRFLEKVEATVRRYGLLPRGKTVAVAVSGGPDSVALLAVLADLAPRWRCSLTVLHVNHGLRGRESGQDARFVRRLAAPYGTVFRTTKLRLGKAVRDRPMVSEELLREKRYEALGRMAREADASVIALGHHRDDLAETVLMRLLRGSGPAGLGGFRPKTRLTNMTVVRPLYDCTRAEILDFCERRNLRWREDRTNRDLRWLRNRIRHELLPLLEKTYNPRLRDLLADNARWFQEDEEYFEAKARDWLGLSRRKSRSPKSLPLATLRTVEPPVLARLFRVWVMAVTGRTFPAIGRQIEELLELVRRQPPRGEVRCTGNVVFFAQGDVLTWRRMAARDRSVAQSEATRLSANRTGQTPSPVCILPHAGETLPLVGRREIVSLGEQTILRVDLRRYNRHRQPRSFEKALRRARVATQATDFEQCFDADRIEGALVLRNRRIGDRFRPLGADGSKSLKDFLIDAKVAVPLRKRLVLLCDDKRVLWVAGLRTADHARLTESTQNILRVRLTFGSLRR